MTQNISKNMNTSAEISFSELSVFCRQVAMLLKSGISIQDGILMLLDEKCSPKIQSILSSLSESLDDGNSFYISLRNTNCFPDYMLNMVNIGEQSGRTEEVMNSLCDFYEREQSIASGIKTAVTYPAVMIAMMLAVIGVLVVKVLPVFNKVFTQLGGEMSSFSQGLMNIGSSLAKYSFVTTSVIAVIVLGCIIGHFIKKSKNKFQQTAPNFFLTKKLRSKIAVGHFASAMSLMMSSGLDTDSSLEMAYTLVEDETTKAKIKKCQNFIDNGSTFSHAITQAELFTFIEAKMIAISFKTGSADEIMSKLAAKYEDDINNSLAHLISIIEPTLVAVLSVTVGLILMSVMLPLLGVMSSMGS